MSQLFYVYAGYLTAVQSKSIAVATVNFNFISLLLFLMATRNLNQRNSW